MKRYLKLLRQSTELWIIALLLAAVTVVGIYTRFIRPGDTLEQNWQDGFIALFVTLLVLLIFEFVKIHRLYNHYKVYEGEYKGYGYVVNDPSEKSDARYDELSSSPVSKASVLYVGGNDFTLELSNPSSGRITHTWKGSLKMTSDNMADIGYKYTKWPDGASLKHSAGYKRAIISEDENGVYIYMFSNDNQRFGREVLVKVTSN
jgi:hypothetical protein